MVKLLRVAAVALAAVAASCDYPQDSNGTLARVSGAVLRVGVSERPPWVIRESNQPAGIEPRLIEAFAEKLEARVAWTWGTESALADALKEHQLDIVIGGHAASSPWTSEVGASRPYLEASIVIAAPRAFLTQREGRLIPYPADRPEFAAAIARNGFDPVPTDKPGAGPAAAYEFEAPALGLVSTGQELAQEKLVILVPPGESRFLYYLDRFLASWSRTEILGLAAAP